MRVHIKSAFMESMHWVRFLVRLSQNSPQKSQTTENLRAVLYLKSFPDILTNLNMAEGGPSPGGAGRDRRGASSTARSEGGEWDRGAVGYGGKAIFWTFPGSRDPLSLISPPPRARLVSPSGSVSVSDDGAAAPAPKSKVYGLFCCDG
ncbi:hypothetical protein H6P81_014439 [Aristolochia fimbriata]|uniref:Uncharacterized protein n=1 Tax=Aristolochia fimbriata TaxID=158543 RepID=A0AAV7EIQ1_ARIFI|nr:hypothetical protein H6P81_014439 [Aristolochia fimbriata]